MKFSTTLLSALTIAGTATAAAVPAELMPRGGGSCPSANPYNYCCDFIQPGLLDLNLGVIVSLCNLLGINLGLGLDVNLEIGTQCIVTRDGTCSGGKKHKCCSRTAHSDQYGTCGY